MTHVDRSIIGAGLGGALADPVSSYPSIFGNSKLFKTFPYLLPNLVCTAVVIMGLIVGFLFLEETHQDKRHRDDIGLKIGRQLLRSMPCLGRASLDSETSEESLCSADDEKGDYRPVPTSPQMTPSTASSLDLADRPVVSLEKPEPKVSFWKSLTKQIKLIIVSYGLLAL